MSDTSTGVLESQRQAIEAKLRLAQEHLDMASLLMREAGQDSVSAAGQGQHIGLRVEDARAVRDEAESHTTVMEQIGVGIGRMLGLLTLFFAGARLAASEGEKHPQPKYGL